MVIDSNYNFCSESAETKLSDDHDFVEDVNGVWGNSVICKYCGQKGYLKWGTDEYHTEEPEKAKNCSRQQLFIRTG